MSDRFCAGIIIRDGKILLLQRSISEDEPHKWCPINGEIKNKETPEQAVVREVKEETGLDFTITRQLPLYFYKWETIHVFLGTGEGQIKLDPEKIADYGWFSYAEAMSLNFAYGYNQVIQQLSDLLSPS